MGGCGQLCFCPGLKAAAPSDLAAQIRFDNLGVQPK